MYVEYRSVVIDPEEMHTEQTCDGAAGDWLCTMVGGHDGPHRASGGFVDEGRQVYAIWDEERSTDQTAVPQ